MVQPTVLDMQFNGPLLEDWLSKQGRGAKERLAVTIGRSASFIEKLMQRKNMPNGDALVALADAMGVSVEKLVLRRSKKSV